MKPIPTFERSVPMKLINICLAFLFFAAGSAVAAPPANFVFSPYVYSDDYDTLAGQFATSLNMYPKSQTAISAMPAKLNALTWAFAIGSCENEVWSTWSNVPTKTFVDANKKAFVDAGKKYIVSTGGASHTFNCASAQGLVGFIGRYYTENMIGIDFDIENGQSQAYVDTLVQQIAVAQATYPKLRYSFTVGSYGGSDASYTDSYTKFVVNSINKYKLTNYTINLMAMNMDTNAAHCTITQGRSGCDMGKSAVQAAKNLNSYYKVPLEKIELTVLIGAQDAKYKSFFTNEDVAVVSDYAVKNNLAGMHFWAFSRDRDCAEGTKMSLRCNSYGKAGTLGFTNRFLSALGY